jgi:hypothetical protein
MRNDCKNSWNVDFSQDNANENEKKSKIINFKDVLALKHKIIVIFFVFVHFSDTSNANLIKNKCIM